MMNVVAASAAMNTIGTAALPSRSSSRRSTDGGGEGGRDDSADNESTFESASFYLGRNLSRDMAEIGQHRRRPLAEGEREAEGADVGANNEDDDADDDVNEIPVWVRGESRWIAGVSAATTAADLVEALLLDDPSLCGQSTTAGPNGSSHNDGDQLPPAAILQQFVITERWRQMEQILEPSTKVWKIWRAWGEAQCEVRLRLRKIDQNGPPPTTTKKLLGAQRSGGVVDDAQQLMYDSGRESPTGSAIVRRRRHRASKSTAAWLTQAQTVHPKSSKSTIEKLMSLILEQGETIQQQLSRLRDREIQISQLEEQKHRIREQEHGKNYLLETYLNGLHEAEEKDLTTINSDSGVNTEDTQSPNGGTSPLVCAEGEEKIIPTISQAKAPPPPPHLANVFEYTDREAELLREHEQTKSLKLKPSKANGSRSTKDNSRGGAGRSGGAAATNQKTKHHQRGEEAGEDGELSEKERQEMEEKIAVLEKIYVINKHLQKEEELLVRLNAKIKRYESENPNLKEDEILDTLHRLNSEIEQRSREIEITNREIELSDELLNKKSAFLNELSAELGKTSFDNDDVVGGGGGGAALVDTHTSSSHSRNVEGTPTTMLGDEVNGFDVNPENIYNISKILLKYSDGVGGAAETDRDRHSDRINIAACHRPAVNKTDNNKRIIIGNQHSGRVQPEMGALGPNHHHHHSTMVTTEVQIHKQPPRPPAAAPTLLPGPMLTHPPQQQQPRRLQPNGSSGAIDYPPYSTGTACHQISYDPVAPLAGPAPPVAGSSTVGGCPGAPTESLLRMMGPAGVSDFTPVDLITTSADMLQKCENKYGGPTSSELLPPMEGFCNKVVAINSARNISSTLMDNKKLAHKNFILTSKAYEGLSSVAGGAPLFGVPQQQQQQPPPSSDMTQLGTLV